MLQVGEARALYNIGNVFHAKGKKQLWGCTQDPGDLPPDVRDTLQRATTFYEYVPATMQLASSFNHDQEISCTPEV